MISYNEKQTFVNEKQTFDKLERGNVTSMPSMPELGDGIEEFNASLTCNDTDFLSLYVFRPRVVSTIHAFMNACVPKTEDILPESWDLCTKADTFDCDAIFKYASSCRVAKQSPECGTTTELPRPPRCGLGQMIDTSDGLFVLVFVLVLGILIGLASNIAICLIFPKIHSWMLSKVHGKPDISRERSYKTHYSDIDDVKIQQISEQTPNELALYGVSNINSDYSGSDYELGDILCNTRQKGHYEQLRRGVDGQLSKKYDALNEDCLQNPTSENDNEVTSPKVYEDQNTVPNYFVLEKT